MDIKVDHVDDDLKKDSLIGLKNGIDSFQQVQKRLNSLVNKATSVNQCRDRHIDKYVCDDNNLSRELDSLKLKAINFERNEKVLYTQRVQTILEQQEARNKEEQLRLQQQEAANKQELLNMQKVLEELKKQIELGQRSANTKEPMLSVIYTGDGPFYREKALLLQYSNTMGDFESLKVDFNMSNGGYPYIYAIEGLDSRSLYPYTTCTYIDFSHDEIQSLLDNKKDPECDPYQQSCAFQNPNELFFNFNINSQISLNNSGCLNEEFSTTFLARTGAAIGTIVFFALIYWLKGLYRAPSKNEQLVKNLRDNIRGIGEDLATIAAIGEMRHPDIGQQNAKWLSEVILDLNKRQRELTDTLNTIQKEVKLQSILLQESLECKIPEMLNTVFEKMDVIQENFGHQIGASVELLKESLVEIKRNVTNVANIVSPAIILDHPEGKQALTSTPRRLTRLT